ncbi:hypothetical protein SAMN02745130_02772 [Thiothrix eikelboomii]|uniref:Uncharacterized protein n=1 Tax=Thiothrix eikelboomii TaxID=92487 RepID=A0A1T4XBU2_9GAMM|nr:hypothetical protein [Thiothrix eikelboomii]SKA86983.1 hypothetical protein SAMN02745130_02772 [Thiothrix eikelboomii]
MTVTLKTEFDAVLEPLGKDAAEFFLAASLYHAQKISFAAAAALACLSFKEFLFRLREHFGRGLIVTDEIIEEDLETVAELLAEQA